MGNRRSPELARLVYAEPAPPALAQARTSFLVALSDQPQHQHPLSPSFPCLVASSLASPHAPVRALACSALPGRALSAVATSTFDPWRAAVALVAKDPSSLVRDAACRALGLLAKSEPPLVSRKQDHAPAEAVRVLLGALTPVECGVEVQEGVQAAQLATSAAFWTLANCCDLLAGQCVPSLPSLCFSSGLTHARTAIGQLQMLRNCCRSPSTPSRANPATSRYVSLLAPSACNLLTSYFWLCRCIRVLFASSPLQLGT